MLLTGGVDHLALLSFQTVMSSPHCRGLPQISLRILRPLTILKITRVVRGPALEVLAVEPEQLGRPDLPGQGSSSSSDNKRGCFLGPIVVKFTCTLCLFLKIYFLPNSNT